MKSTVSVTTAQAQLPRLIRGGNITGIMKHNELTAFIVPRERMESLLDTLDFLGNPDAKKAIKKFQSGKMTFYTLAEIKAEFENES